MIHKNVIIGSGFSSLGAILALEKKKEKFLIITGKPESLKKNKNLINLPSRNFDKYKKNIYQSLKKNNLSVNIKNNFISYLGLGGLSNLWGKIFNLDISGNFKIKNELIKTLKLKNHTKIDTHKNLIIYKANEQKIDLKKKFKNLEKKKFFIINSTVENIKFNIENQVFNIYLTNNKVIKTRKLYLATGIFSTLKLLRSINKKIFQKKIELSHNNMCYGIFFVKKNKIFKNLGNEFVYFSYDKKKFAGRISILNKKIIEKYNLNFFFYILMKLNNFFRIEIFLLNVLYKRPKNSSIIYFKNNIIKVKINRDVETKHISNKLKKVFHKSLNVKRLILKKTLVGSDFHYSCDIRNNLNTNIAKIFYKNLFILDNSISANHKYFPTFQMIYESFYRVKYNLSLKKIIRR